MRERAFTAGWLVAAAVLSSWAVSSASEQPRATAAAPAQAPVEQLPALSIEVETQIARLAARTGSPAAASALQRDPFRFGGHRAAPARMIRAAREPEAVPAAPEPVESVATAETTPQLSGVVDMARTLTAVISFRDELHYVKKGDVIAGRYRVESVSIDGVNIFDLVVGTILRLSLQSVT